MERLPSRRTAELAALFMRCGYVRRLSPERRKQEGRLYKKGHEVRFVLASEGELRRVRRLLRRSGLRVGRPFQKHSRFVQPVYGQDAFAFFIAQVTGRRTRSKLEFSPDGRRLTRRAAVRPAKRGRVPRR